MTSQKLISSKLSVVSGGGGWIRSRTSREGLMGKGTLTEESSIAKSYNQRTLSCIFLF